MADWVRMPRFLSRCLDENTCTRKERTETQQEYSEFYKFYDTHKKKRNRTVKQIKMLTSVGTCARAASYECTFSTHAYDS